MVRTFLLVPQPNMFDRLEPKEMKMIEVKMSSEALVSGNQQMHLSACLRRGVEARCPLPGRTYMTWYPF